MEENGEDEKIRNLELFRRVGVERKIFATIMH